MSRFLGVAGSGTGMRPAVGAVIDGFIEGARRNVRPVAVAAPGLHAAAAGQRCLADTLGSTSFVCIGTPRLTGGASATSRSLSEGSAIAARFSEIGARVLDEIHGPFAIAMFDSSRSRGLVAIDRMGIQPLFFSEVPQGIAFGSSPTDVVSLAGGTPRLSEQALFDYLYGHVIPAPRSIYEGVLRLLPGECIEIEDGRISRRRYWQPEFVEDSDPGFSTLKENFLEALRASVQHAMQNARCGAFLSGGTDSSTVAGLMAEIGREPPMTFSIGFAVSGYDEMEYARLASAHFHTKHHEYYVTPQDVVDAMQRLAVAHPQPFGNSSALPAYFCAKLARDQGIECLLAGDGGDELFGGNERYATQRVFSFYERIPAPLRHSVIEPLCRAVARRGRPPVIGKLTSYVQQASIAMPARLETYNLLARTGYSEVLHERLVAAVDTTEPARLNEQAYFNPSAKSLINRMLALDFKTTLADSDLPKVVQSCELAEIGVAFPMLDSRVVDFSLSLPPATKLNGTQLRPFFKRALHGFLPEPIIRKRKHGFGLPFGAWVLSDPHLRELTFDALNSLKRRDLVRPEFIDRLTGTLLPQYPNYYGTMAWILTTLELWLETNMDKNATPVVAHAESA